MNSKIHYLLAALWLPLAAHATDVTGNYGMAFERQSAVLDVQQAINAAPRSQQFNETIQVQGRITEVCQMAGCWVVLGQEHGFIRVVFQDHSFAVPKKVLGRDAVVQGVLRKIEQSAAQLEHLRHQDGGHLAQHDEWQLVASGIQIL